MTIFENVLFGLGMEEYNPSQCQDEIKDDEDEESDPPEPWRNLHNFYTCLLMDANRTGGAS